MIAENTEHSNLVSPELQVRGAQSHLLKFHPVAVLRPGVPHPQPLYAIPADLVPGCVRSAVSG